MVTRRELLFATAAAPLIAAETKIKPIDISRISAFSDELARSPADAIAFAHKYGMQWLDLRGVPGAREHYATMDEDKLKAATKELADNGIRCSQLAAGLLKFSLPGTTPLRRTPETPEAKQKREARDVVQFEKRMDDLRKAIINAHILGAKRIRVFAFSRVEDPAAIFPRIADIIGPMADLALKEGVQLQIENEASCNVATCAELVAMGKLVPSKGFAFNWDTMNGGIREVAFPDGYNLLPKDRIGNVHMKGMVLLDYPTKQDWVAIMKQMAKDGYKNNFCLETHINIGGPEQIPASHKSMEAIQKVLAQL
jgi:sugar phosphate isomerase/epimerase